MAKNITDPAFHNITPHALNALGPNCRALVSAMRECGVEINAINGRIVTVDVDVRATGIEFTFSLAGRFGVQNGTDTGDGRIRYELRGRLGARSKVTIVANMLGLFIEKAAA